MLHIHKIKVIKMKLCKIKSNETYRISGSIINWTDDKIHQSNFMF